MLLYKRIVKKNKILQKFESLILWFVVVDNCGCEVINWATKPHWITRHMYIDVELYTDDEYVEITDDG